MRLVAAAVVLLHTLLLHRAHTNFLHDGCLIRSEYRRTTFEDFILFHMIFPVETFPPVFTVEVEQGNFMWKLQARNQSDVPLQKQWVRLKLMLKGTLQLRFMDDTVWLTGDERQMTNYPEKKIRMKGGGSRFLKDCPQESPNWVLEFGKKNEWVPLREGRQEVVSLLLTSPTMLYLEAGREELVMCWLPDTSTTTVFRQNSSQVRNCDRLPGNTQYWLQFVFHAPVLEITDPGREELLLTSLVEAPDAQVTFSSYGMAGTVFMVHHLHGYPAAVTSNTDDQPTVDASTAVGPYMGIPVMPWVPVMAGLLLLLLVSAALATLFYQRWTKSRQVLLLLRSLDDAGKFERTMDNLHAHIMSPALPLPTRPLPVIMSDNHYMKPRPVPEPEYEELDKFTGDPEKAVVENPGYEYIQCGGGTENMRNETN